MILKNIEQTIIRHRMICTGDHLVVALSGGPDSTALLHMLMRLAPHHHLCLTAAHLNHGLRDIESDREESFVRKLCLRMGVQCVFKKLPIGELAKKKGKSLEEAARDERYRFLLEVADKWGASKIATGHHRDDQAETLLINLFRGTGVEGMKGIMPVRDGKIIRPLLNVDRSKILAYLNNHRLPYLKDSSNEDPGFLRNKVRMEMIPILKDKYNPNIVGLLSQTADIMRREGDFLQQQTQKTLDRLGVKNKDEIVLPVRIFEEYHEAIQWRVIKAILENYNCRNREISYRHVEAVLELIQKSQASGILHLPGNVIIEKNGDTIKLFKKDMRWTGHILNNGMCEEGYKKGLNIPGVVVLPALGRRIVFRFTDPRMAAIKENPRIAFLDFNRIQSPLRIRFIHPGDRMVFLGMSGRKKVNDYFIERKIPKMERGRIPLLLDNQSIVWVAGERISERVKVTSKTEKVLMVEMI